MTDPDRLHAGRFVLRAWTPIGWWDDVEFGRLVAGDE